MPLRPAAERAADPGPPDVVADDVAEQTASADDAMTMEERGDVGLGARGAAGASLVPDDVGAGRRVCGAGRVRRLCRGGRRRGQGVPAVRARRGGRSGGRRAGGHFVTCRLGGLFPFNLEHTRN